MKKLQMNPIMKKEMMVGSRSIKMSLAIMGINLFLAGIVLLVMLSNSMSEVMWGYDYSALNSLFILLACVECGLISIIVPVITSGSISGERERQTLDIMLTTPVSPFSIAVGKLGSALMVVMMYMITSIPVMAISFVLGGMSWWSLFGLFGMLLYLSIYVGSVGVFSSSVVKKSVMATILTIVIGFAIIIMTFVIFGIAVSLELYKEVLNNSSDFSMGAIPMIMLLNPYSPIVDFMIRVMTGSNLAEMIESMSDKDIPSVYATIYKFWIPVSVLLNLLISYVFLKLAARNIAVTRNKKKKGTRAY